MGGTRARALDCSMQRAVCFGRCHAEGGTHRTGGGKYALHWTRAGHIDLPVKRSYCMRVDGAISQGVNMVGLTLHRMGMGMGMERGYG